MAGTVNKVILIGRLGADPEVRYAASGDAITNFNLATDEPFKTPEGTWESKAEWHRIVAFGKLAERCGEYLTKGKAVYVEGKLKTRQWEDKEGVKRYTTEIQAREVTFLGGRDSGEGAQTGAPSGGGATPGGGAPPSDGPDEEIPF